MEEHHDTSLHVRISHAKGVVWEGEARSVSSENSDGPFDILPMHANFITLIRSKPISIVDAEGKEKRFTYDNAVIHVQDNKVNIYTKIQ